MLPFAVGSSNDGQKISNRLQCNNLFYCIKQEHVSHAETLSL